MPTPNKTAIQRDSLFRPLALALEDGLLSLRTTFSQPGSRDNYPTRELTAPLFQRRHTHARWRRHLTHDRRY